MFSIRRATVSDADALLGVYADSIRAFGRRYYTDEQVEAWHREYGEHEYVADVEDDGTLVVVAEDDEAVIGFGELDAMAGEISAVYVRPEHARRGIGTALLDELETEARDRRLDSLGLLASLNAVDFYEAAGYRPLVADTPTQLANVGLTCLRMRKRLG